ncbi:putative BNR repeat neuraminidase [Saccharothrix carnea]|uniref:Putative BNR repeat neuraminidase n=1 Tax=Saccharothrix carnea TaxID=1280637 RepID=A0A2P8IBP1_SACCR|nr:putative BNR repeat neuraminidase [Saccharothrix carnea]
MVSDIGRATTPSVTSVSDTLLDPAALYFVSYDGVVNNNSFQRDAILTHAGHQYATWYTGSRNAVVARRRLGGEWERVVLPHRLSVDDSHNVISLGISPEDATLHVAMDTHDNRVFYVKSVLGPRWDSSAFGEVQRTLDGVELGDITYPQFVVTPEGVLQLSYRTGRSGNGVNELAEYRDGTWTRLGAWSSASGDYTAPNGAVSGTRNMYLHGLDYDGRGRLHAAFTWREGDSGVLSGGPGGLANHDTGYVYSDDRGRTWRNDAGTVVGTTGGPAVSVSSPGVVIDHLSPDRGLMNQEAQAVDSTGTPHVVISYVPERFVPVVSDYARQRTQYARTFHLTRSGDTWTKREVPVPPHSTQRTKLAFDRADNAYLVMPRGRIVAASRASGWTDWTTVFTPTSLNAFGEVNVDTKRVAVDGVLSVQYQQASTGTTPSPIRVADFRLP